MKNYFYASLLILLVCSINFAQTEKPNDEKTQCPEIMVMGPPGVVESGEIMVFTLEFDGEYDTEKIKINWTIDKGTIVQGQGTNILQVRSIQNSYENITVTVEVEIGECKMSTSETSLPICTILPPPFLIDEFGKITKEDFLARIDSFIVELQNNPDWQGYIINHGSAKDKVDREKLFRKHLNFRKFDLSRIVFVNGEVEKEIRTRLWRVPFGGDTYSIN